MFYLCQNVWNFCPQFHCCLHHFVETGSLVTNFEELGKGGEVTELCDQSGGLLPPVDLVDDIKQHRLWTNIETVLES